MGISSNRAATVSSRAFTPLVAVAAVAWRDWTCDSRTKKEGVNKDQLEINDISESGFLVDHNELTCYVGI